MIKLSTYLLLATAIFTAAFGIYISYYTYPTAWDDLHRGAAHGQSFIAGIKAWYLGHNGRFTNMLLTDYAWLYKKDVYRLLPIAIFIFWLISLFYFLKQYFLLIYDKSNKLYFVYLFSLINIAMLTGVPTLYQWWFWYATSTVYFFSLGLCLLNLALLIKLVKNPNTSLIIWLAATALAFFNVGNNEIMTLIILAFSFLFIFVFWKAHGFTFKAFLPFIFAILGFIILLASPATRSRAESIANENSFSAVISKTLSLFDSFAFMLTDALPYWLSNGEIILSFFISAIISTAIKLKHGYQSKYKPLSLFFCLVIGFIIILLAAATIRSLLNDSLGFHVQSRVSNLLWVCTLLIFILFGDFTGNIIASLGANSKDTSTLKDNNNLLLQGFLLIGTLLFIGFSLQQKNVRFIFNDIYLNKHHRQENDIANWEKTIKQHYAEPKKYGRDIVLPGLTNMQSNDIYELGIKADPGYRINKEYLSYLGVNPKRFTVKREQFDHAIIDFIQNHFQALNKQQNYLASLYQDDNRKYLLLQLAERSNKSDSVCITLADSNDNITISDENNSATQFAFAPNDKGKAQHCTDFVNKKMYCQAINENWFCRVPIPRNYQGQIITNWLNETQKIVVH